MVKLKEHSRLLIIVSSVVLVVGFLLYQSIPPQTFHGTKVGVLLQDRKEPTAFQRSSK
jgi:hypothetical protein